MLYSNLIISDRANNNNLQNESQVKTLQQNLIKMGFDINLINKVILYFNIKTENEALDYLIKTEDGLWNHPFIPKEINIGEENNKGIIIERPKILINSVIDKIKELDITNKEEPISKQSNIKVENEKNNLIVEHDICEICGELKEFHIIKDYQIKPNIQNKKDDFDKIDLINMNEDDKLIMYEDNNIINTNTNNLIKENNEEEKEEEEQSNQCLICMDELEDPVEIEKCKHKFCSECFNSYLVNLININNIDKIPCPKNKCWNKELTENFFSQYLSEQEYFKYRQFKAQNEISRDEKKFFCPHCDSYAQIEGNIEDYDVNNPNYTKSILKCKNGHEFCSCGRPIHENSCYRDENEFKELLVAEQIKKCPKCGFLIKKNRGCNHMTCGNPTCKYEFCWLCMNEAVPGHYDYGPCAGRQFFDPDSFENRLNENYPILGKIYSFFLGIVGLLLFFLAFVFVPGLGLSFLSYGILYEEAEPEFDALFVKKTVKFFELLICICLSFCFQNFIYIFWALLLLFISIVIASVLAKIVLMILGFIIRLIFGCNFNSSHENSEDMDIELSSHIDNNNISQSNNSQNHNNI